MPKTVYVALHGGDDKGGRMEYLCTCENEETATLAAKGKAFYGANGMVIKGLVVTDGDGANYLLGMHGLTKGGQARTINILEGTPTESEIAQFLKDEAEFKSLDDLRSRLSSQDIELIKKFQDRL